MHSSADDPKDVQPVVDALRTVFTRICPKGMEWQSEDAITDLRLCITCRPCRQADTYSSTWLLRRNQTLPSSIQVNASSIVK